MKSLISKTICLVAMMASSIAMNAQVTGDVLVAPAVAENTSNIGGKLSKVNTKQSAISTENLLIYAQVDSIRKYETIMYGYLKEAHNIFGNLQQIAECVDLGKNIVTEIGKCADVAGKNPANSFLATIVSKKRTEILEESIALTNTIASLVQGSGNENLINSAERLQILYNIHYQLTAIYQDIRSLRWEMMNYNWMDLFANEPDFDYLFMTADEKAYNSSVRRIDKMSEYFK